LRKAGPALCRSVPGISTGPADDRRADSSLQGRRAAGGIIPAGGCRPHGPMNHSFYAENMVIVMKQTASLITLFCLFLLLSGCKQEAVGPGIELDRPAPDFTLVDTTGKTWSLADLRGRVVLVNFWASWCQPCLQEMPSMQELNGFLPEDKFTMLSILFNDAPAFAENIAERFNLNFPILIDPENMAARAYGLTGVPETYIIDKEGVLRKKFIGPVEWNSPEARQMMLQYIAQ
jgi:cytochrome c biogenesis protein CcmG, thiol:disulfide interchange protein DsbE